MDADKNAVVSCEEDQSMHEARHPMIEGEMEPKLSAADSNTNSIKSLFESLTATDLDDDIKEQLSTALEKMQSDGNSQKTISESISLLNNLLPSIKIAIQADE